MFIQGECNVQHPKIGLALGSGGARGFAHVGVLKALENADIKVDYIAGSSMGALVGAFYGAGHNPDSLYKMATMFKRKYYLDYTVPKMGLISGNKIRQLVRVLTHGKQLENLVPPLSVVATDLLKGEKVVYQKGSIADAVRASISIPGIFVPFQIEDRLLVDGGVIDRVPVSVVKDMGAEVVIGVDISHYNNEAKVSSLFDVFWQSIDIMQREMVKHIELNVDILIRPMVEQFSPTTFTNVEEIIRIGEDATKQKIGEINRVIHIWGEQKLGT
jgi:NTE family protein